ncbi:hypothetical protein AB0395_47875 [Streptosporangium sp. NPDC051023]|uniref:hypothetical protein n=1 Tax=Streptosporangium sp. NPDC051023 TaxID=3155410 RepID=UPI00344ED78B
MDDFDQLIADLDRRGAWAWLCLAAGGTREEANAIMRGEGKKDRPTSPRYRHTVRSPSSSSPYTA